MGVSQERLAEFLARVLTLLDERQRRLTLGAAALMVGQGGNTAVADAAGVSRNTVIAGVREVEGGAGPSTRVRRPGGGRKAKIDVDPNLLVELDGLVEPGSRGDPMSPLRWTLKSTRNLAAELTRMGYQVSSWLVGDLLRYMGFSLQGTAKQITATR